MKSIAVNNGGKLAWFLNLFKLKMTEQATEKTSVKVAENQDHIHDNSFHKPHEQRKAYVGNYFAGPHCLFDPRFTDN